jgi:hypothetical protein
MTQENEQTLAEVLGTDNEQEQINGIRQLHAIAETPVFCLTLYYDPRRKPGFDMRVLGPETPLPVLRKMLNAALESLLEMEIEQRLKAKEIPPTSE